VAANISTAQSFSNFLQTKWIFMEAKKVTSPYLLLQRAYANNSIGLMKASGHELKGLMCYIDCRIQKLHFPLMVVIDYKYDHIYFHKFEERKIGGVTEISANELKKFVTKTNDCY